MLNSVHKNINKNTDKKYFYPHRAFISFLLASGYGQRQRTFFDILLPFASVAFHLVFPFLFFFFNFPCVVRLHFIYSCQSQSQKKRNMFSYGFAYAAGWIVSIFVFAYTHSTTTTMLSSKRVRYSVLSTRDFIGNIESTNTSFFQYVSLCTVCLCLHSARVWTYYKENLLTSQAQLENRFNRISIQVVSQQTKIPQKKKTKKNKNKKKNVWMISSKSYRNISTASDQSQSRKMAFEQSQPRSWLEWLKIARHTFIQWKIMMTYDLGWACSTQQHRWVRAVQRKRRLKLKIEYIYKLALAFMHLRLSNGSQ